MRRWLSASQEKSSHQKPNPIGNLILDFPASGMWNYFFDQKQCHVRALESQLNAEQSLTGRHWNSPKKDTQHQKTKEKLQWDSRRGTITIKSNPITTGLVTQTGEQSDYRSLPTGVKVLSPTSGFPTSGSGKGRRNSQRIRPWRLAGFDCRTSTGLG